MRRSRYDPNETRDRNRLKAVFVGLTAASGGSIALWSGAPIAAVGVSVLGGILVGVAFLWYFSWVTR